MGLSACQGKKQCTHYHHVPHNKDYTRDGKRRSLAQRELPLHQTSHLHVNRSDRFVRLLDHFDFAPVPLPLFRLHSVFLLFSVPVPQLAHMETNNQIPVWYYDTALDTCEGSPWTSP